MFFHALRARIRKALAGRGTTPRTVPSFKPTLQALEDRLVMATRIWDGGAASNNWTNASNWAGNIAPVAGDDLVFPSNAPDKTTDNNFSSDTLFNSITVAGGYTQRGARVLLGNGGIISSGSSNIIKHKINLSSTRAFNVNTGSTLFIDDDIVGGGGVNKTGGGNLSFRNNNSYAGVTDIQAGILFIEKDNSLGSVAGGTVVRNGATLLINDQVPLSVIRTDERITLDGGTIRALNDVELRGNITTQNTGTLKHEGGLLERLLVTGQISGPGGITIANASGAVLFRGTSANTYQGLTTVAGKLRLDNTGGAAVTNNITINATGVVRLENNNQIGDNATVTVQAGGMLLTNEKDDTFRRLVLQGGEINGDRLRINDYLPAFIVNGVGNLISRIPLINTFVSDRESDITLDELEATSTGTSSARIVDVSIVLTSIDGLVRVNNGPAANDLLVFGTLFSAGSPDAGDNIVTLVGNGKTLLQDFPADQYFINGGELQIAKFKRELISPTFGNVDITVAAGAKFTGDVLINDLHVLSGGRVHPGPFNRPTLTSAVFVQLRSGILGVSGDLTLDPGAILEVQLNGPIAGVNHEQIDVTSQVDGAVNINGAIIEATLGLNVLVGQNYRIINNAGIDLINGLVAVPPGSGPFLTAAPTGQKLSINQAGGLLNNDLILTLQNTPPMAPGIAIDQTEIDEGDYVTVTGHLVDPDPTAQLRLLINWGDGTPDQIVTPGRADFSFRHRYLQDGDYVASFVWLDQFGQGNSREFAVTVNNVAPQALMDLTYHAGEPELYADFMILDPGADPLTLTVDYGDDTPAQTFTVGRRRTFGLKHRFAGTGTFTLTFTLRDSDGGVTQFTRQVTA
jgi:autotransporter-associated beta strand protein